MRKIYTDYDIELAFKYGSNYVLPDPEGRDTGEIFRNWLEGVKSDAYDEGRGVGYQIGLVHGYSIGQDDERQTGEQS